MTLTFGNIRIGTGQLYLFLMFVLLFTDMMFFELFFGKRTGDVDAKLPEKLLVLTAVMFTILSLRQLSPFLQRWGLVGFIFLIYMVVESFYLYNRPVMYPHVFSKVLVVFVVLYLYPFFRDSDAKQIKWLAIIILSVFFAHLIILKPEVLTINSFVNVQRGFTAASVYLLLLPCLYFFNTYLAKKNFLSLAGFFVALFFIFFLQHRTVWITTAVALVLNIVLLKAKGREKLAFAAFIPLITIPAIAIFVASALIIAKNPEFVEVLVQRVEDIQNVQEQGTGSWRLEQFVSYLPHIQQHLLAGMRWEGFELPIQFFQNDEEIWLDGTGHHFHSWYVDRLFYFGLIGLVFIIIPMFYLVMKTIRKTWLSVDQIIIITFALSGIVYGISYDWPLFSYGILGIALAYVDRESDGEVPPPAGLQEGASKRPRPQIASQVDH